MAIFEFRGIFIDGGKATKGVRDAENVKSLRAQLRRDGILLTSATEEAERKQRARKNIDLFAFLRKPKISDVAVMTRQLATLVRAGVPLVDSLAALTEQVEKESLQTVLRQVKESVNEGTAFSKSLAQFPKVFPPLFINMVAAGEASGTLEAVLERLADFMEGQSRLRGKVAGALAYPILMVVVGSILVGVLMVAVVPKVTSIFENLGRELPWYTQLLIFTSNTMANWWWLILLVGVVVVTVFQRWKSKPAGRMTWDRFMLRVPVFGRLNLLIATARFSRTLSTLLGSGVQLLQAMEIGRNVLGNARLEEVVTEAIASIREGESISVPFKRSAAFPPMLVHMIAVGEQTGQLEAMLENVSRAYEADVDTRVMALTGLLEPAMIVLLGGAVGFIALSILMPLMQINSAIE